MCTNQKYFYEERKWNKMSQGRVVEGEGEGEEARSRAESREDEIFGFALHLCIITLISSQH